MKYAVVYVGCVIVEADSEPEAEEAFYEGKAKYGTEKFVSAKPCYRDMYTVADELVDSASSEISS